MRNFKKLLEALLVMFLFYGNIFMGYFTKSHLVSSHPMSLKDIVIDMSTPHMFLIALTAGIISYVVIIFIDKQ
jgi:hypothetical protein